MVRTTSAWCMYEFPTMSFITYILVFTTWFLMLCLFLMIARTLMFSKTFSIVFDVKNKLSSSLNIWLISFRISRTDPLE